MLKSLFGGVALGASAAGIYTYFRHKKTLTPYVNEVNRYQRLEKELMTDKEKSDHMVEEVKYAYKNLCEMHNRTIDAYDTLVNPDMLADISNINDDGYRDECLEEIERASKHIKSITYISDAGIFYTEDKLESDTSMLLNTTSTMSENIKRSIYDDDNAFDDDDDDDNNSETQTVSPRKLILNRVDGEAKIFDTDPDVGFEVLDGSNPDANDYCIVAQNVPALYNFLFNSIKSQLQSHYVSKISADAFDNLLEDMIITISFSFINDTDAEITEINAVVPFEVFNDVSDIKNNKIYCIKNGELTNDNIIHYFRSISPKHDVEGRKTSNSEVRSSSQKMEKKVVKNIDTSLSEENIKFITESIDFNRESLKSFVGKLGILLKANPEAGEAINDVFRTIIIEIHDAISENKLSDEYKASLVNTLKALNTNMRKNYGADIKRYSVASSSDNSDD